MKQSIKSLSRPTLFIVAIGVLAIVAIASASYGSSIEQFQSYAHDTTSQYGLWAPILYILAYTLIGLTGFSVTVLSLVAIGIFDTITAFFVIVIGASLSASLAFLLARSSNYKLFSGQRRMGHSKKLIFALTDRIEQNLTQKPFRSVLVLRFTRLPYIAFSYAAGLATKLSFNAFVAATIVSNSISALVYVLFGTDLVVYIAGISLVIVAAFGIYYTYRTHK